MTKVSENHNMIMSQRYKIISVMMLTTILIYFSELD